MFAETAVCPSGLHLALTELQHTQRKWREREGTEDNVKEDTISQKITFTGAKGAGKKRWTSDGV